MIRLRTVLAVAIVLLGLSVNSIQAQYQLITINPATGVGTAVTPVAVSYPFGLAFQPGSGKLYTWDGFQLYEISKATGAILNTLNFIFQTDFEEGDLAFRSDGKGFLMALSFDDVCMFDIATSTSSSIGFQNDDINGLAFDAADTLYGIAAFNGKVYTINQVNGNFTLVGNSGVTGYSSGLAFDAAGKMYMAMAPFGGASTLYSINKATGVATAIGPIGFNGITGIRFDAAGTLYGVVESGGAPIPGVSVNESGGSTDVTKGGASDFYNVVLKTKPTANVTITITPGAQLTIAPLVLTFTPANWNVAQTVTVKAIDDGISQGFHQSLITHSAASGDAAYNGIAIPKIFVNITDVGGAAGSDEGSYAGSVGPAPLPATVGEGSYGFGGGHAMIGRPTSTPYPFLRGPIGSASRDGCFRVVNVSSRQVRHNPLPSANDGLGVLGGTLLAGLGLGLLTALGMRYRPA